MTRAEPVLGSSILGLRNVGCPRSILLTRPGDGYWQMSGNETSLNASNLQGPLPQDGCGYMFPVCCHNTSDHENNHVNYRKCWEHETYK